MEDLFKNNSQKILIYMSVETVEDPFDKNVSNSILNSLPIDALVNDLIASQASWKMPGIEINKAKQIIIEKKYEPLFLLSYRIRIGDIDYKGWKVNGALQYRIEGNYLRAYIYSGK